ncbi:MAG: hypothetical protein KUG56_01330, partial [Kordiimonadaceae bacterium]|nr:hypothetical protein [Kordiimonadaceae bacterium]
IANLNVSDKFGVDRVGKKRRNFLTGRDMTSSVISNLLELWEEVPLILFNNIDQVRKARNKIVHGAHNYAPDAEEAAMAINTANALLNDEFGIKLPIDLGYGVMVL